jgi:hypothetical protein
LPKFQTTDVFGHSVVGSFSAWDHAIKGHPEMADKEDWAKAAIEKPVSVHSGNTAAHLVFRGLAIAVGFWAGSFPVAVVEYNSQNVGFFRTAYLSSLEPIGKVIWAKS